METRVENTPISQHVLGVCWVDGCRRDEAVSERKRTLRRVMGEGADGQEGGEGEFGRVLLGARRGFLPSATNPSHAPSPALVMPKFQVPQANTCWQRVRPR